MTITRQTDAGKSGFQMTKMEGSSAIASHGYDPATQKLRVETHTGKVYEYDNVSVDRYAAFTGAKSAGSFWNSRIKPNHPSREVMLKK